MAPNQGRRSLFGMAGLTRPASRADSGRVFRHGWDKYAPIRDDEPLARAVWRDRLSGNQLIRPSWSLAEAEQDALALRVIGDDDVRVELHRVLYTR